MTDLDMSGPLKQFHPRHEFFVGIDSDGCAFDTMGIKQRECFCPMMIGYFGLQPVAYAARQCKEFADLFSKTRGANRHKTIKRILTELLPGHPQVRQRGFKVPQFEHYCRWVDDPASLLSNEGLEQAISSAKDPEARSELTNALTWSRHVNESIARIVKEIPPFPFVRKSLQKMQAYADVWVVSATPSEALKREWQEHDIAQYAQIIAGQEMGTKKEHLSYAGSGKYRSDHMLMIGDAPGDMNAAKANNILFYPINPGSEAQSWQKFYEESFDKFLQNEYAGGYEQRLIEEFDMCLPESPPWEKE